jgi:hypothetical protein
MRVIFMFLLLMFSCNKDKSLGPHTPTLETINQVSRDWAERKGMSAMVEPGLSDSTRDALLFDGLLCFSGEQSSCAAVKASQDPSGRFWRSPENIGKEGDSAFSPDMALGPLLYFVKTRDTDAALAWLRYIESQGGRTCPEGQGTCKISAVLWSVFYEVWRNLGLSVSSVMEKNRIAHESLTVIVPTTAGHATHLIGVEVLILQAIGVNKPHTAFALVNKQPENPFYRYLRGEVREAANWTVAWCPVSRPLYRFDWIFQRDAPYESHRSSGWDCIFMSNLLLSK